MFSVFSGTGGRANENRRSYWDPAWISLLRITTGFTELNLRFPDDLLLLNAAVSGVNLSLNFCEPTPRIKF